MISPMLLGEVLPMSQFGWYMTTRSNFCLPCFCRPTGSRKAAKCEAIVLANILKERRRRSRLEPCDSVSGAHGQAIHVQGILDTTSMDARLIDELPLLCRRNLPMHRANRVRHPTCRLPNNSTSFGDQEQHSPRQASQALNSM